MNDKTFFRHKPTSIPNSIAFAFALRQEIITIPFALIEAIKDRGDSIAIIGPNREWELNDKDTCVRESGYNPNNIDSPEEICSLIDEIECPWRLNELSKTKCVGVVECFRLRWQYFIESKEKK